MLHGYALRVIFSWVGKFALITVERSEFALRACVREEVSNDEVDIEIEDRAGTDERRIERNANGSTIPRRRKIFRD